MDMKLNILLINQFCQLDIIYLYVYSLSCTLPPRSPYSPSISQSFMIINVFMKIVIRTDTQTDTQILFPRFYGKKKAFF